MISLRKLARKSAFIALAVLLSACANGPDPDRFVSWLEVAVGEAATIGKQWNADKAPMPAGGEFVEEGEEAMSPMAKTS